MLTPEPMSKYHFASAVAGSIESRPVSATKALAPLLKFVRTAPLVKRSVAFGEFVQKKE